MASLLLGDLNDYIEPTQACIIPPSEKTAEAKAEGPTAVSINLTDCLACSGCITSAETVLVAQQTYSRLLEALDSRQYEQVVVSVSPQTVAALAVKYRMGVEGVWRRLNYFLKRILGVSLVLDTAQSRSLTLALLAREFLAWRADGSHQPGPLIVSACPGWVCYVEKRYREFVPLLSRTRSPQQMAGTLVKHVWRPEGRAMDRIFHCTVMPCFDKKLEASREDFVADLEGSSSSSKEVDTVITTTELVQVLAERLPEGMDFPALPEDEECGPVGRHEGSGSGGYLEHVLAHAIHTLHPHVQGRIERIPGRNPDSCQVHFVEEGSGRVLLRFAAISGFRNIQTFVVRQRKAQAPELDFIEVMACPGGCLMGGGQPKASVEEDTPSAGPAARKRLAEQLNEAYHSAPLITEEPPLVKEVLEWVEADPERRQHLLRASFKAVEDNEKLKKKISVQW